MTFESEIEIEDLDKNFTTTGLIKWEMEIDYRAWGVKSFDIYVPDQKIQVFYVREDVDGNDVSVESEIEIKDPKIEESLEIGMGILTPKVLEIFKGKQVLEF